jgi:RNA polymerase sigma-70 factor (ECF subfamily)
LDRKAAIAQEIPRLRRYARALVRDHGEADDLVQDCLVRALGGLDGWRDGASPRKWLFAIMHNLHIDHARARARRPHHSAIDTVADRDLAEPARQLDHLNASATIEALFELPPERREALLLVAIEGMSYREAAAVVGVPVGTLVSRLGRGRAQLRATLGSGPPRSGCLGSV